MKNVELRCEGSTWVVAYDGVEHWIEYSKMVPYVIGSLVGSLDDLTVNGIPLEKWIFIF